MSRWTTANPLLRTFFFPSSFPTFLFLSSFPRILLAIMTPCILFNTRLLFLILFCYFDLGLSQAQCFFPSGEEADDDIPCNPTAADSVCCGPGWTCLSSKICEFNQDSSNSDVNNAIGEQWRGSCTDRQWDSGLCPKFCYGESAFWSRN